MERRPDNPSAAQLGGNCGGRTVRRTLRIREKEKEEMQQDGEKAEQDEGGCQRLPILDGVNALRSVSTSPSVVRQFLVSLQRTWI